MWEAGSRRRQRGIIGDPVRTQSRKVRLRRKCQIWRCGGNAGNVRRTSRRRLERRRKGEVHRGRREPILRIGAASGPGLTGARRGDRGARHADVCLTYPANAVFARRLGLALTRSVLAGGSFALGGKFVVRVLLLVLPKGLRGLVVPVLPLLRREHVPTLACYTADVLLSWLDALRDGICLDQVRAKEHEGVRGARNLLLRGDGRTRRARTGRLRRRCRGRTGRGDLRVNASSHHHL